MNNLFHTLTTYVLVKTYWKYSFFLERKILQSLNSFSWFHDRVYAKYEINKFLLQGPHFRSRALTIHVLYPKLPGVFHVSHLKKRIGTGKIVHTELPGVQEGWELKVEPIAILDRKLVKRRNSTATMVLVQLTNGEPEEATWEFWEDIARKFPKFGTRLELRSGELSRMLDRWWVYDLLNLWFWDVGLVVVLGLLYHKYPPYPYGWLWTDNMLILLYLLYFSVTFFY